MDEKTSVSSSSVPGKSSVTSSWFPNAEKSPISPTSGLCPNCAPKARGVARLVNTPASARATSSAACSSSSSSPPGPLSSPHAAVRAEAPTSAVSRTFLSNTIVLLGENGASHGGTGSVHRPALRQRGLRRRQSRNRYPERRAGNVIHTQLVAECHRGRLATVLPADAELEIRPSAPPQVARECEKLAHPRAVEHLKRVVLDDALLEVERKKPAGVVAREAPRSLREVVGTEGEELCFPRDLVGGEGGPGELDHRSQDERDRDLPLAEHLRRYLPDDQRLLPVLDHVTRERHHHLGHDPTVLRCHGARRLEDRPGLHRRDLGIENAESAAAQSEHRVHFCESMHDALEHRGWH